MMKLLVVEPSPSAGNGVVEALRRIADVRIDGVVHGLAEARQSIASHSLDLVITGTDLPDGDVVDLIVEVHARASRPAIVVLGALAADEERRRCLDAGADMYLPRDIAPQTLIDRMRDAVLQRKLPRALGPDSRLEAAGQQLLGRIAGGVAHDVANYLTAVDASIVHAERSWADGGGRLDLDRARGAVDRAIRLLRTLVDQARRVTPQRETIDLVILVRRTLDLLSRTIPPHIDVELDLDLRTPPILGVVAEVEQLLMNLIINACDAMPEGGTMAITLQPVATSVTLAVTDSGHGISAIAAEASGPHTPSSKPARAGGGLGLGIVRAVAERHQAALRLRRIASGGTRVEVTFAAKSRQDFPGGGE